MVLKLYVFTKFRENGQKSRKSRKSRNLIPVKFNTFKVVNSVYNGTGSISFSGAKMFDILPSKIKEMETVETFKGAITYGNRKNVRVDFVSAT